MAALDVRRRRLVRVTALAALVLGVFLVTRRSSLDAGAPHPLVAPVVLPRADISACWLETGRFASSTASGLVIRHPRGDIVIDPGTSSRFAEETARLPWRPYLWFKLVTSNLHGDVPVPTVLKTMGVDPLTLHAIVVTHVHLDHLGGALDLPMIPILLNRADIDFAAAVGHGGTLHVVPEHADALVGRAQALQFRREPYEVFDRSADLFEDGSVVAVPLPGHTPGSVGVFVNLSEDNRLFVVGDAVNDLVAVEERKGKAFWLRITDRDEGEAGAAVVQLAQLHTQRPAIRILPAHGRPAWEAAFPDGPKSCRRGP